MYTPLLWLGFAFQRNQREAGMLLVLSASKVHFTDGGYSRMMPFFVVTRRCGLLWRFRASNVEIHVRLSVWHRARGPRTGPAGKQRHRGLRWQRQFISPFLIWSARSSIPTGWRRRHFSCFGVQATGITVTQTERASTVRRVQSRHERSGQICGIRCQG
ncbi:hypothetical protein KCP69_01325 [Salmonella enterica subsp. enterica]|nr:hypothetical protein KCP69_01325 [Salmonella enterica subsp. enterica]